VVAPSHVCFSLTDVVLLAVQAFRKAIGVRIKEESEILEGEVRSG
jgi:DNA helicase TIP49 (TBP-interacting protein)